MITINFRDARPLYEQVKEGIIKLIMTNSFREHEKLPSVRELAVALAINPNTIQHAYHELENEGYIYTSAGKGAFVAPHGETKPNEASLLIKWRETTAKLLFSGIKDDLLKQEIDKLKKEVISDA